MQFEAQLRYLSAAQSALVPFGEKLAEFAAVNAPIPDAAVSKNVSNRVKLSSSEAGAS